MPGSVLISDSMHAQVVGKLSFNFADNDEIARKNIAKPTQTWLWSNSITSEELSPATKPIKKTDTPFIAILPFVNIGNAPENEYFADDLVEDITATLSKLSRLTVIARNASLSYRDNTVDVRQIARELGVPYVLEGSVQAACARALPFRCASACS
jgi:adenylate cyclase